MNHIWFYMDVGCSAAEIWIFSCISYMAILYFSKAEKTLQANLQLVNFHHATCRGQAATLRRNFLTTFFFYQGNRSRVTILNAWPSWWIRWIMEFCTVEVWITWSFARIFLAQNEKSCKWRQWQARCFADRPREQTSVKGDPKIGLTPVILLVIWDAAGAAWQAQGELLFGKAAGCFQPQMFLPHMNRYE